MGFYIPGDTPVFWIAVDDPGYGRLDVQRLDVTDDEDEGAGVAHFAGDGVGRLLNAVTDLALTGDGALDKRVTVRPTRGSRLTVDRREARELLPSLTQAVLLATAGTDRYERTINPPAVEDLEPLCANCNEGSPYAGAVTISSWCMEYGHHPFATATGITWEQAVARHAQRRRGSAG